MMITIDEFISVEDVFELDTDVIQKEFERIDDVISRRLVSGSTLVHLEGLRDTIEQELEERLQSDSIIAALSSFNTKQTNDHPIKQSGMITLPSLVKSDVNNVGKPTRNDLIEDVTPFFERKALPNLISKVDTSVVIRGGPARPKKHKRPKTAITPKKKESNTYIPLSKPRPATVIDYREFNRSKSRAPPSSEQTLRKDLNTKVKPAIIQETIDIQEEDDESEDELEENMISNINTIPTFVDDRLINDTCALVTDSDIFIQPEEQESSLMIDDDKDVTDTYQMAQESVADTNDLSELPENSTLDLSARATSIMLAAQQQESSIVVEDDPTPETFANDTEDLPSRILSQRDVTTVDSLSAQSDDISSRKCDNAADESILLYELAMIEKSEPSLDDTLPSVTTALVEQQETYPPSPVSAFSPIPSNNRRPKSVPKLRLDFDLNRARMHRSYSTPGRSHSESVQSVIDSECSPKDSIILKREIYETYQTDYTGIFSSFYEIFTGFFNYDTSPLVRDTTEPPRKSNLSDNREYRQYLKDVLESFTNGIHPENSNNRTFKVLGKPEVVEIVTDAMEDQTSDVQWEPISDITLENWNLFWSWSSKPKVDRPKLLVWQKINHFSNSSHLTRKDYLKKHINRYKRLPGKTGNEFNILPDTFSLPDQYSDFVDCYSAKQCSEDPNDDKNIWIIKPIGMSRGRGIRLVNDISQIHYKQNCVIQKYVERPLLVNGRKFDLRLYVLVTQFSPLEAFVYQEGFARFATLKYSTDESNLDNLFIHLTNTAIAEKHSSYGYEESKCSLSELRSHLEKAGIDYTDVWNRIINVVLKSLCSVEDVINNESRTASVTSKITVYKSPVNSFELFGYDVLIDEQLKVWLIEVNASPSMERNVAIDSIKHAMIRDTIALLDPLHFDRAELVRILKKRSSDSTSTSKKGKEDFNSDLNRILKGKLPRKYGEMPQNMGNYQRISPSRLYSQICKMKRHL